ATSSRSTPSCIASLARIRTTRIPGGPGGRRLSPTTAGRTPRTSGSHSSVADAIEPETLVLRDAAQARLHTTRIVEETPVFDMHTHLFAPAFGELVHWGIDELLTYHYLIAELLRSADVRPEQYYGMPRSVQADLIWETLFVRNTPLSEAACGVIAVLTALGLDPLAPDLREARAFFQGVRLPDQVDRVLARA